MAKAKIKKEEIKVLLNFLKSGLPTRQLDDLLGYDSKKSKGWKSWDTLKKYKLEKSDRGKLFCLREQECKKIIKELSCVNDRAELEGLLFNIKPKYLEKYLDTYILADTHEKVLAVLSGEVRNITQSFFNPLKRLIGECQYLGCRNKHLDTVHLRKSRPEIFKEACKIGHISNSKKYNVYKVMRQYIQLHSRKKSICFLCKKHHEELSKYEKSKGKDLRDYQKYIKSDF